jgi:hypothetical protein
MDPPDPSRVFNMKVDGELLTHSVLSNIETQVGPPVVTSFAVQRSGVQSYHQRHVRIE